MGGIEDDHAGLVVDGILKGNHIDCPVRCGGSLCGTVFWGLEGDVADFAAGHFDVGDVSGRF